MGAQRHLRSNRHRDRREDYSYQKISYLSARSERSMNDASYCVTDLKLSEALS